MEVPDPERPGTEDEIQTDHIQDQIQKDHIQKDHIQDHIQKDQVQKDHIQKDQIQKDHMQNDLMQNNQTQEQIQCSRHNQKQNEITVKTRKSFIHGFIAKKKCINNTMYYCRELPSPLTSRVFLYPVSSLSSELRNSSLMFHEVSTGLAHFAC